MNEASFPPLYIWIGTDPVVQPPDVTIDDVPGVSDLDLVAEAIARGQLGRFLPSKIALSPHQRPNEGGFRSVDVARLLRDYRIPHQRRFEILPATEAQTIDQ